VTLFGQTLDPQQMGALAFSLTALAAWCVILVRERKAERWFKQWEADRKARRDAEIAAEGGPPRGEPKGPWG
jgi:hypothetical protein